MRERAPQHERAAPRGAQGGELQRDELELLRALLELHRAALRGGLRDLPPGGPRARPIPKGGGRKTSPTRAAELDG